MILWSLCCVDGAYAVDVIKAKVELRHLKFYIGSAVSAVGLLFNKQSNKNRWQMLTDADMGEGVHNAHFHGDVIFAFHQST